MKIMGDGQFIIDNYNNIITEQFFLWIIQKMKL